MEQWPVQWASNIITNATTATGYLTTGSTLALGGGGGGTLAYQMPVMVTSSGSAGGVAGWPPPAPQTPLEWLDREVERTCALARG